MNEINTEYEINSETNKETECRFTYHPPCGDQLLRYQFIRKVAKDFAIIILSRCPSGPEKVQALINLDQCVMWANASIARRESQKENNSGN